MRSPALLLASALLAGPVAAQAAPSCGGWPHLPVRTPDGWCVGVVATAADGLRMPRTVLWQSRRSDVDELLLVDIGNWEPRRGRLLRLEVPAGGRPRVAEVLRGLDRPHGLLPAPGGAAYVAETTRILRVEPGGGQPAVLVDNLPAEGRHPVKALALGADGRLLVNVGAPTDRCEGAGGVGSDGLPTCPGMGGPRSLAAVWVGQLAGDGRSVRDLAPLAIGLRNSMALAVHSSGTLLQAENSIDLPEEKQPPEEINRLVPGGHYGWPGCVGRQVRVPGTAADCGKTVAPVLLMPAHAAPLHMAYSRLEFGLPQAKAREGLLVSWHGYRAAGQRLVRYDVDPNGVPFGPAQDLIAGWRVPEARGGGTLAGAPVGFSEDASGRLWIADDRNRMLLVLQRR